MSQGGLFGGPGADTFGNSSTLPLVTSTTSSSTVPSTFAPSSTSSYTSAMSYTSTAKSSASTNTNPASSNTVATFSTGSTSSSDSNKVGIIVGTIVGVAVLVGIILAIFFLKRRNRRKHTEASGSVHNDEDSDFYSPEPLKPHSHPQQQAPTSEATLSTTAPPAPSVIKPDAVLYSSPNEYNKE